MKKKLIFDDLNYKENIYALLLIMIIGGIFGFLYETIFYYFDLGYLVKRGTTFGPWIPIYAFGSLFITILTYRYRKSPLKVFSFNILITGILEYGTGLVLDKFYNLRLWDYNKEILNFGNINGYICLRSVLFFSISSLLLIYIIIPTLKKFIKKSNEKLIATLSIGLICLFILDMIIYRVIN